MAYRWQFLWQRKEYRDQHPNAHTQTTCLYVRIRFESRPQPTESRAADTTLLASAEIPAAGRYSHPRPESAPRKSPPLLPELLRGGRERSPDNSSLRCRMEHDGRPGSAARTAPGVRHGSPSAKARPECDREKHHKTRWHADVSWRSAPA